MGLVYSQQHSLDERCEPRCWKWDECCACVFPLLGGEMLAIATFLSAVDLKMSVVVGTGCGERGPDDMKVILFPLQFLSQLM